MMDYEDRADLVLAALKGFVLAVLVDIREAMSKRA